MKQFRSLFILLLLAAIGIAADITFPTYIPQTGDSPVERTNRTAAAIGSLTRSTSIATGQAALSTSAAQVLAANTARRSVVITNHDASISVYVGATGVTTSTGLLIKAGAAVTINSTAAIFAIAASGTPTVSYLAEND